MEKTFKLKILAPEKPVAELSVSQVQAPGVDGQMGILPGHAALVSALRPGILTVWQNGEQKPLHYYVGGGYLQFCRGEAVVLSEVIEVPEQLDRERAEKAEKRAAERLARTSDRAININRALMALERARSRRKLLSLGKD